MIYSKFGRSFDDWAAAERAKRDLTKILGTDHGDVVFSYVAEFSPDQLRASWFLERLNRPWYATPTWLGETFAPHVEGLCAITDDSRILYLGSIAALADLRNLTDEGGQDARDEVLKVEDRILNALRQGQTLTAWRSAEKDPQFLAALVRTHRPVWTVSS